MKHGISSTQSSNEQSLFQELVYRGFLQECLFPSGVKGLESHTELRWVHAWPSQINSDTDSPSGSESSSTTQQRQTGTKLSPMHKPCSPLVFVNNYWTRYLSQKWVETKSMWTHKYIYTHVFRDVTYNIPLHPIFLSEHQLALHGKPAVVALAQGGGNMGILGSLQPEDSTHVPGHQSLRHRGCEDGTTMAPLTLDPKRKLRKQIHGARKKELQKAKRARHALRSFRKMSKSISFSLEKI